MVKSRTVTFFLLNCMGKASIPAPAEILSVKGYLALAHIFVMVPRPGDYEETFSVIESSSTDNPVKCLAQGHNKRTCQRIFTLPLQC